MSFIKCAIYDTATGAIKRYAGSSPEDVANQVGYCEEFYLNCPDTATHIINNDPVTIVPEVVPPALEEVKAAKYAELRSTAARSMLGLAAPYLSQERESWDTQFKEATEWMVNSNASVPMIAAMANSRGITVAELVGKIMENANLYRDAIGAMLGKQQRLLDEVAAATTVEAVNAIAWQ